MRGHFVPMALDVDIFVGLFDQRPCFAEQASSPIEVVQNKVLVVPKDRSKDAIVPEDSRAGLGLLPDDGCGIVSASSSDLD